MAEIRVEALSKAWSGAAAVSNLSATIADGEFFVLLGPSGCGKSTTLRLIAGLDTPSSGKVFVGGRDVTDLAPKARDLAMVFQDYALYPHLTAYENIAFPLRRRALSGQALDERVRRAAERLDITPLLPRKPHTLSGGQRQRLALARAIVREPQGFLMDEPLSHLDPALRTTLRTHFKALQRQLGATTLYVTHDQMEAMSLADRVGVLHGGVLLQVGTPEAIYSNPQSLFVATALGASPINQLHGVSRDGRFLVENADLSASPFPGRERLVLGIRPENVRFVDPNTEGASGRIASVEWFGDVSEYKVETAAGIIRARAPGRAGAVGQNVRVAFAPEAMLWFDPESGDRVSA